MLFEPNTAQLVQEILTCAWEDSSTGVGKENSHEGLEKLASILVLADELGGE